MALLEVSKDKYISKWADGEKIIYVRRNSEVKTLSEVKLVENISKNLQSFLVISHVQKEVLLSHNMQDHAYE